MSDESLSPASGLDALPLLPSKQLRGFERISVPLCRRANQWGICKSLLQLYVRWVPRAFVSWMSRWRWELHGHERLASLEPRRGILLVSNHRTFFDMYVGSAVLYEHTRFMRHLVFPVRSDFFYSSPIGLLVNFLMSGCAMWPPVFREARGRHLNPVGLEQMNSVLARPGTVLGFHPEGTRNKGADPYSFLPPKAGLGRMIAAAHPDTLVLPFFILGMSTNFLAELKNAVLRDKGAPSIRLRFGDPVPVGELDRTQSSRKLCEEVLGWIQDLAEEDRKAMSAAGSSSCNSEVVPKAPTREAP